MADATSFTGTAADLSGGEAVFQLSCFDCLYSEPFALADHAGDPREMAQLVELGLFDCPGCGSARIALFGAPTADRPSIALVRERASETVQAATNKVVRVHGDTWTTVPYQPDGATAEQSPFVDLKADASGACDLPEVQAYSRSSRLYRGGNELRQLLTAINRETDLSTQVSDWSLDKHDGDWCSIAYVGIAQTDLPENDFAWARAMSGRIFDEIEPTEHEVFDIQASLAFHEMKPIYLCLVWIVGYGQSRSLAFRRGEGALARLRGAMLRLAA